MVQAAGALLTVAVQLLGRGNDAELSVNPKVVAAPRASAPFHEELPTVTLPPL